MIWTALLKPSMAIVLLVGTAGAWGFNTFKNLEKEEINKHINNETKERTIVQENASENNTKNDSPSLQDEKKRQTEPKTLEQTTGSVQIKTSTTLVAQDRNTVPSNALAEQTFKPITLNQQKPSFALTQTTTTHEKKQEMKYIYTIVKASDYGNQPVEEMKSGEEHNYKCQWFDQKTNTTVEAKCFVSSTTMKGSKNLQWDIRNSETNVSKAELKETGKFFLLKIENKINYNMFSTPILLINVTPLVLHINQDGKRYVRYVKKANAKQYASLTEKQYDLDSKYLIVNLSSGNGRHFRGANKNEDFLIATTSISNDDGSKMLSIGNCLIENEEKKSIFLSDEFCRILEFKQNKEILKTPLEQEALSGNNSEFGSIKTIDYYNGERNLQSGTQPKITASFIYRGFYIVNLILR